MTEDNKKIPGDRGTPSVAMSPRNQQIFTAALICLALVAMISIVLSDNGSDANQPLVTPQDITFKSKSNTSGPYIKTEPLGKSAPMGRDAETLRREEMLQKAALRMAAEKQKQLQKRLHSPQVIYDQPAKPDITVVSKNTSTQIGNHLSGMDMGDPNVAFAAGAASQGFASTQAVQMKNLDSLIPQGTMIAGILETAIQSDLPGMVRAVVSDDVYSFNGKKLIIPKGSKLVGQYRSGLVRGQSRVFVIWNRMLRSDGVTINLGSFGTDDLGRSGLDGKVNTHFFQRFGSSLLLSMIDTSLQIIADDARNSTSATVALETGNDFSRAAEIALKNSIGIPPTVEVEQGKRIKVFVSQDLDFSTVMGKTADASAL